MNRTLPLATLTALLLLPGAAARGQVVYHETFDHYGIRPPGTTDASQVAEYPPSLKSLAFRPAKASSVYEGAFRKLPREAQGLTDFEFEFTVTFQNKAPQSIDCRLEFSGDAAASAPNANCVIRLSGDTCGIASVSNFKPQLPPTRTQAKDLGIPFVGTYPYRCLVRVQGKTLSVFLIAMGRTIRIGGTEMPGLPFAGFNFGGSSAFDLDDIIVRKIAPLPEGDFRAENGTRIANQTATYDLAFPPAANVASASVCLGNPGDMRITLNWADGATTPLNVSTFSGRTERGYMPVIKETASLVDGKLVTERKQVTETLPLPDAGLEFKQDKSVLTVNVRPQLDYLLDEDKIAVAGNWQNLPPASRHFFKFEVRRDPAGIEYWIDGRYVGRRDAAVQLNSISFLLPAGGAIREAVAQTVSRPEGFLPLQIAHIANPGAMAGATLPFDAGSRTIQGIPFTVVPGPDNLDLGVVKENFGTWALECDYYLSRTAFSGLPESLMLSVPNTQYTRAYILCAVADDPARDPILTARLTRFLAMNAGGRGPAIADTTVTLPRAGDNAATLPPGVTLLGHVQYSDQGQAHRSPLYLVELPIDSGKLQGVIFGEKRYQMIPQPYLDFEVLGKTDRALQQLDKEFKPDPTSKSAVHVFGITLASTPVEMQITPARIGNAYSTDEKPTMTVSLRSRQKAACRVAWEARDVDGKVVDAGEQKADFNAPGQARDIAVTPKVPGVGHYQVTFQLFDAADRLLLKHAARFALVAPDTRKAGYDSPFFSWWFNGAHLVTNDLSIAGPLLTLAGIHRSLPKSEEEAAAWKLTTGQLGNFVRSTGPSDMAQLRQEYSAKIDEAVHKYPHAKAANIFHEGFGGDFPLELYGIKTPLPADSKALERQQSIVAKATLAAQLYREKHPDIRPTLVNSGDSMAGAAVLMRHQMPKEALTAIGEESLGQTMPPESWTAGNMWQLRELTRRMGYGDIPLDACYEWKGRNVRDLGERKAAAWRQRDALIAFAWGCRLIPMSGFIRPENSYFNSVWGDDYMFSGSAQMYPFVSFSTTAHFTQLLDRAVYSRLVPTGTISVYATEFKRGDQLVYALWTVRGSAELSVTFDQDAALSYSDMFGRTRTVQTADKSFSLTVSGEPSYLVTPAAVKSIVTGRRIYSDDQLPAGASLQLASAMDKPDAWQVSTSPDARLENVPRLGNKNYLPFRVLGKYELRAANDQEKGACLEVELRKEGDVLPFLPEYALLKLKEPASVSGTPSTIGLWVKGNSGWGQLMWEIQDAEGETFLSCGTGGYGCDVYDWTRQASINFDGWNFIQFPITGASPVHFPNPGGVSEQWQTSGNGNGRIDFPIKVSGLAVNMTRSALNLTEMVPVNTVIRLKDLSVY